MQALVAGVQALVAGVQALVAGVQALVAGVQALVAGVQALVERRRWARVARGGLTVWVGRLFDGARVGTDYSRPRGCPWLALRIERRKAPADVG